MLPLVVSLMAASAMGADAPPSDEMRLHLLPSTMPRALGGRCMDGTMAPYYYREGNPELWVIYLQGGGACYDKATCDSRAQGRLGSSKHKAPTKKGNTGPLNTNCTANPGFCGATQVYVPYCTSDTHSGNNTDPSPASWGYYFDGHANLVAIINQLEQQYGLGKATMVLLTGGSAGAIGVFRNVDWLAARLPGATVKGAPNAGWFFPAALSDDLPDDYPPSDWAHFAAGTHGNMQDNITFATFTFGTLWQVRGLLPLACMQAQAPGMWVACQSVHKLYKYIKTPLFVLENQYDTNQIQAQEHAPAKADNASEYALLAKYVSRYGEAMRNSTMQVLRDAPLAKKTQKDGLFHTSCFSHSVSDSELINGSSYLPILTDWFFEQGALAGKYRMVEHCGNNSVYGELPCNPNGKCAFPAFAPDNGTCKDELKADGCLKRAAAAADGGNPVWACEACAQQHRSDLTKYCTSEQQVKQLCTAGW